MVEGTKQEPHRNSGGRRRGCPTRSGNCQVASLYSSPFPPFPPRALVSQPRLVFATMRANQPTNVADALVRTTDVGSTLFARYLRVTRNFHDTSHIYANAGCAQFRSFESFVGVSTEAGRHISSLLHLGAQQQR